MTLTIIMLNSMLSLVALSSVGVCLWLTGQLTQNADDEGRADGHGPWSVLSVRVLVGVA
jgi:hypothetical protein